MTKCSEKRCEQDSTTYLYFILSIAEGKRGKSLHGAYCKKHAEEKAIYFKELGRDAQLLDISNSN